MTEDDLARWIVDRTRQHALAIAVRAALRCLWYPICERQHWEESSLIGLRLCALGVLNASDENAQPRRPSRQLIGLLDRKQWSGSESIKLWRALNRVLLSIDIDPPEFTEPVVNLARHAADIISNPADHEDSWSEIHADLGAIVDQPPHALLHTELFSPTASKYIIEEVAHSISRYRERNLDFLADWYESTIFGRVDAEFLQEIAGLPDDNWTRGAEHVREHLAAFEIGRRLRDATPLAEEIVFDEPTGKLRVEPVRMLPPDLYETGLEKLQDALDDARAATERNPNSYSALPPTLEMLERTLAKYHGNPQRVHDDQLLALRRLEGLVEEGYVPNDEEIASLVQVLDTNAVDIRAAVPAVAAAVKKRSEVRTRELEPADRDRIRSAVDAVASNSEDSLAEEMREDDRATFESGDAPVNVESPYRLASRLGAVERTVRSLERIAEFADRSHPLMARLAIALSSLAKLVGL